MVASMIAMIMPSMTVIAISASPRPRAAGAARAVVVAAAMDGFLGTCERRFLP